MGDGLWHERRASSWCYSASCRVEGGVETYCGGGCCGKKEKQRRAGKPSHGHQQRVGEPGKQQRRPQVRHERRVVMVLPVLLVVVALGEGAGTCFCGGCSSEEEK